MKKTVSRLLAVMLVLALSLSTAMMASAATTTFAPTPKAEQDGENGWFIDKVTVTPTTGTGFTLSGTQVGNIAWRFTLGQLKKTPMFNLKVLNEGAEDAGMYMKVFFYIIEGSNVTYIYLPDYTSDVENWVRVNAKTGLKTGNLLEALEAANTQNYTYTDDAEIYANVYIDPAGTTETLQIGEMSLTGESSEDSSGNGSNTQTGYAALPLAVAAGVVVLSGGVMVISRKKATK